jgi:hypothetical protein
VQDHQGEGPFPTDEAALKVLCLALRHIQTHGRLAARTGALPYFRGWFGDRFVLET